jgi:stage III sporulation protein SpoIIIAA
MLGYDGSIITGLTYKVGRTQQGAAALLGDVLHHMKSRMYPSSRNLVQEAALPSHAPQVLMVAGPHGSGKTSLLRDIARYLADDCGLSVVVVDTYLEIGGGCLLHHAPVQVPAY